MLKLFIADDAACDITAASWAALTQTDGTVVVENEDGHVRIDGHEAAI